jgi:peptidoglycan hydrolase-like protein with peptidoglycan-binding domain
MGSLAAGKRLAARTARLSRRPVPILIAVALVAVGIWLFAATESPEQRARASAPPAAPVVTSGVERRVLRDVLRLTGTVASAETIAVMPPQVGGAEDRGFRAVVTTAAPTVGATVEAGGLLVAVSGRPVFLIQGDVPLYRDLVPGVSGADVEMLQLGLEKAGYPVGRRDGLYGPSTQRSVRKLWTDNGFEPTVDESVAAELDAAKDQLSKLLSAQTQSPSESTTTAATPGESEIARLEKEVRDLEARSGPIVPVDAFIVAPVVPATVVASDASLGRKLDTVADETTPGRGALLELSASPPAIEAQATAAQITMFRKDMVGKVSLGDEQLAMPIESIGSVGDGGMAKVVFRPATPLGLDRLGESVDIEVELLSSDGEVLAVPVSALRTAPGESEEVVRVAAATGADDHADRQTITVETGAVVGGWVEIRAAEPSLAVGDRVIVGE